MSKLLRLIIQGSMSCTPTNTSSLTSGTQTNWYNYTNKQWANAVVLTSGTTKDVGDTISESEIALWYVWIPRYKYTIFNGNNGSVAVQEINVTFESGTNSTGTIYGVYDMSGGAWDM